MKTNIILSLRNTAQKGSIFFSLVMRFKNTEKLFPIGDLSQAKEVYMVCLKDTNELKSCWESGISPAELEPISA